MTRKIYKSAQGKTVDLGALVLQNERVRAVGNMNVNAAGDLIDSTNRVIERRSRQVQRQYGRQTNVSSSAVVTTSNQEARKLQVEPAEDRATETDNFELVLDNDVMITAPVTTPAPALVEDLPKSGGLAAAIARSREIKQELEKTRRQQQQSMGVKKI